jgi:hypothetical protein
MNFSPPYVLYASLQAPGDGRLELHVEGYQQLLLAVRDDRYDWDEADRREIVESGDLPILKGIQ